MPKMINGFGLTEGSVGGCKDRDLDGLTRVNAKNGLTHDPSRKMNAGQTRNKSYVPNEVTE